MSYLIKEKFSIADLTGIRVEPNRVIICEPEEYLAALYGYHLMQHNFDVRHCRGEKDVKELLLSFSPRLLVINIEAENLNRDLLFSLCRQFPSLNIITIGYNIGGEVIKKLMSDGICGHIDRRLSRPKDLIYVVKAVLNN